MFMYKQTRAGAGRRVDSLAPAAPAWNPDLLSSFTFLMAGHGRSVSAAMMLGDPAYAQLQLGVAHGLEDALLQRVVREMEDELLCGVQLTGASLAPRHRFTIPYHQPLRPAGA